MYNEIIYLRPDEMVDKLSMLVYKKIDAGVCSSLKIYFKYSIITA